MGADYLLIAVQGKQKSGLNCVVEANPIRPAAGG
jgi:hypothetical protein